MKTYHIVENVGNKRIRFRTSKNLGTCLARVHDIARNNRERRVRQFELWEDLDLIGYAYVEGKEYQTRGLNLPTKEEKELDRYYATRNRKMIVGHRTGDISRWILKSGSIIRD